MAKKIFTPSSDAPAQWLTETLNEAVEQGGRTLIEQTYRALRSDIIRSRWLPGEKLKVQHLAVAYTVSQGTLREALTRLVSDALVVPEGQRGFTVAPMHLDDLEDLTRLRVHLETEALRLSMRHGSAAWRERLQLAFDSLSEFEQPLQPEHIQQWELLNTQFHETLVSGYESPWNIKLLRMLSRHSERYRHCCICMSTKRDVHAEHTEIFEYLMAGNEARAALALEAHIRATPDYIKANFEHNGLARKWGVPAPA